MPLLPRWVPQQLSCALLASLLLVADCADEVSDGWYEAFIPEFEVDHEDAYVCVSVPMPEGSSRLVEIEPKSTQEVVHHMLLYGCDDELAGHDGSAWECLGHSVCGSGGIPYFMYGWGKNAPVLALPEGVGYAVGPGSGVQRMVLQVHYLSLRPDGDRSGLRVRFSSDPTPQSAGLLAFARGFTIPPKRDKYLVQNPCCYNGMEPLHTVGFRVHTHALGRSVYMDRHWNDSYSERVLENSPQKPQGFYPTDGLVLWPGDSVETTCVFDSSNIDIPVNAGPHHQDEMCNLYLMSFSMRPVFMQCNGWGLGGGMLNGPGGVPFGAELVAEPAERWAPPQPVKSTGNGNSDVVRMGQVASVALGLNGTLWVFHRGTRYWDSNSFNDNRITYTEPIAEDVILLLDQDTGEVLNSFGSGLFYMPHMITLDRSGALWVTDVGLHQALKLSPEDGSVLLALGTELEPGGGNAHLCKPTQVAVDRNGHIYVTDGYCNSRVVEYSADGAYVRQYTLGGGAAMTVPHSVLLDECSGVMLVADRENKKVHKFRLASGEVEASWQLGHDGYGYPYALAFGPYGSVFALTWTREAGDESMLLQLDIDSPSTPVTSWQLPGVSAPHDLALLAAPTELTGASERLLAVAVAETRASNAADASKLHKFVLLPPGMSPPNVTYSSNVEEVEEEARQIEDASGAGGQVEGKGVTVNEQRSGAANGDSAPPEEEGSSQQGTGSDKQLNGDENEREQDAADGDADSLVEQQQQSVELAQQGESNGSNEQQGTVNVEPLSDGIADGNQGDADIAYARSWTWIVIGGAMLFGLCLALYNYMQQRPARNFDRLPTEDPDIKAT